MLISCPFTTQLICAFVFAYAKNKFSHHMAPIICRDPKMVLHVPLLSSDKEVSHTKMSPTFVKKNRATLIISDKNAPLEAA